jgi:23S rRNA (pseudouridine1915-N3)-methyltransferase
VQFYLFAFGKLRTPGLREAADHYLKMMRPWVQLVEIELKTAVIWEKNPKIRQQIQEKEAQLLLKQIHFKTGKSPGALCLLDETGKAQTTQAWSKTFLRLEENSITTLSICIGSSMGFAQSLRKQALQLWSFGPQTFSHELARTVFLEQLYRSYSLIKGHPYHNDGP